MKDSEVIAIRSLSSMIISLLSVVGIVFTILVYMIVSPSLSSLQDSSSIIFDSIIIMSDATAYNSNAIADVVQSQSDVRDNIESSIKSSRDGVRTTRLSLAKLQSLTGHDYSEETISLKESEEALSAALIEIQEEKDFSEAYTMLKGYGSGDFGSRILREANTFRMSIATISTIFTGLTVILILVFVSMILLSAEDLLT